MKILIIALMVAVSGCSSYSHMERIDKDTFYVLGTNDFVGFTWGTIQKCKVDTKGVLNCKDATVEVHVAQAVNQEVTRESFKERILASQRGR